MAPSPSATTVRAIALVRISDDPHETFAGVGRQEQDCRALAERNGWTVTEVIVENDTSAYKTKLVRDPQGLPRRVTIRPEFERALGLLNGGQADALIVYAQDRLARQPHDLERVIDLATSRGVLVTSYTGGLDLTHPPGITQARIQAAIAWQSSADTARRVSRAARAQAEAGQFRTGGFRPYGYTRAGEVDEAEAAIVREMVDRLLLGDATRAIAADLTARGVPAPRAERWSPQGVRAVVLKPTIAGLRHYKGAVVADGQWPAIVEVDRWKLACAVLAGRKRSTDRSTARHLLSGIVRCGVCERPMYVGKHGKAGSRQEAYRCLTPGCYATSRNKEWLEEHVTRVVEGMLRQDSIARARRRQGGERPARAMTELLAQRERRQQLLRDAAVDLSVADLRTVIQAVDERIAELEAQVAEVGPVVDLPRAKDFRGLPLDRQRAVIRHLVRVDVMPQQRKGSAPEPETVSIVEAF